MRLWHHGGCCVETENTRPCADFTFNYVSRTRRLAILFTCKWCYAPPTRRPRRPATRGGRAVAVARDVIAASRLREIAPRQRAVTSFKNHFDQLSVTSFLSKWNLQSSFMRAIDKMLAYSRIASLLERRKINFLTTLTLTYMPDWIYSIFYIEFLVTISVHCQKCHFVHK